jgi:aldose 1-epimerase
VLGVDANAMKLDQSLFGRMPDGAPVPIFTLANARGMVAKVCAYGVTLTELHVPDAGGIPANVVLGFDKLESYLGKHPAFGATIGRFANRIAGAAFDLDGKRWELAKNSGGRHHIHGGVQGFHRRLWDAAPEPPAYGQAAVRFSRLSPDGEEGYPGNLRVSVTVTLTEENELILDYAATTDKPTPLNLTNHTYFNLACSGDVLDHALMIAASHYTPSDADLIPTGEIALVRGTALDFTSERRIGERIAQVMDSARGYDHNYVLDSGGATLALAARARDPRSGRVLEALTTEPGVQLYTANGLDGSLKGPGGVAYVRHGGFCLETQHFPDSPNKPQFPSTILHPGAEFRSATVFRFPQS